MNKKIVFLSAVLLFSLAFGVDIEGTAKSSFGFMLAGDRDNSWITEKAAGSDMLNFKSTVGLTLKNKDTSLYCENKFTVSGTAIGTSAVYLYINTDLKSLPGSLRIGYHRFGILDAEIHPYSDGAFYTYCRDKGAGVSYYVPVGSYNLTVTQLGTIPGLDGAVNNSTSKTFLGVMLKSGKDRKSTRLNSSH